MSLTNWNDQWTILLALSALLFGWKILAPRFGIAASLLYCVCAYSSIYVWSLVHNRYLGVDPYNQMALRYFACDSIAKLMLVLAPLLVFSGNRLTFRLFGELAAGSFIVVNSLVAIFAARHGCLNNECGGVIGNPSISMSLMACCLPISIRSFRRQWHIVLIASFAIFVSRSSIALGLLGVFFLLHFFLQLKKGFYARLAYGGGCLFGLLGLGRFAIGKELTNDSDRFLIWKYMFDRWRAPWNLGLGTGLGTYHVFSINLQNIPGKEPVRGDSWWNTLHNEPLQILFECGIVGLVLLLCTYSSALCKLWREKDLPMVMSVIMFGIFMTLNPALHNPFPALFGAWLFTYALRQETTKKEYL